MSKALCSLLSLLQTQLLSTLIPAPPAELEILSRRDAACLPGGSSLSPGAGAGLGRLVGRGGGVIS